MLYVNSTIQQIDYKIGLQQIIMKRNMPKIMQVNGCLNIHQRVNHFITSRSTLRVTNAFNQSIGQKNQSTNSHRSSRPFKTSLTDWRTFYIARNKSNSIQSTVLPEYKSKKIYYTGYNKSQINHARALSSHFVRKKQGIEDENLYGMPTTDKKDSSQFVNMNQLIVNKARKKQFHSGKLENSHFVDLTKDKKQNFRIRQEKQKWLINTQVDFFKKNNRWRKSKFNPQMTH